MHKRISIDGLSNLSFKQLILPSADIFQNLFFSNIFSGTSSECLNVKVGVFWERQIDISG